jgi:hypothetical protein
LAYLEIPILAKFIIATQGSVKPSLFAGPAVAIILNNKFKAVDNGTAYEGSFEGIKSTDFGLAFGGGLEIIRKITVDLRYTLGLTKIAEIEGTVFDIKNGAFSLMIGYSF